MSNWKKEIIQCSKDFSYYAEHYLKIRNFANEIIPFKMNVIQKNILLKAIDKFNREKKPIRINYLKSRRIGGSTLFEALAFHDAHFHELSENLVIAQDLESSGFLHSMCKLFLNKLPDEMRPKTRRSNRREILFDTTQSRLFVETADNVDVGRSKQIKIAHCSEVGVWSREKDKSIMIALEQSVPELPGTMIVYETTAKGAHGQFYQRYFETKEVLERDPELSAWINIFVPWFEFPDYSRALPRGHSIEPLDAEERELVSFNPGLSQEQLYWRRYTILNKCQGDVNLFKQEYPSSDREAFLFSSSNVFPVLLLDSVKKSVKPRLFQGDVENASLRRKPFGEFVIYEYPAPFRDYVLGIDVAEGIGRDDSTIQILDTHTFEQVAEYKSNKVAPEELARIAGVVGKLYNNAVIGCEVNNHGATTNKELIEMGYTRLYRRRVFDKIRGNESDRVGWRTSKKTKPIMEDDLRLLITNGEVHFNSLELIHQLQFYIERPDGSTGASGNNHDDLALGMMIAVQTAYNYFSRRRLMRDRSIRQDSNKASILQELFAETFQRNEPSSPAPLSLRELGIHYRD